MEFGVKIPGTVEEAVSLNKKNSNSLCQDYIEKEKKNSRIPFKLLYRNGKPPVVYTKITFHLVFDLKLDMKIKPWYVSGGHLMDVPTNMIYLSVVSCDTLRIGLLMDATNGLDIIAVDIQNSFLGAPTQ